MAAPAGRLALCLAPISRRLIGPIPNYNITTGPASLAGPFVLAHRPVREVPFVVRAAAADITAKLTCRYGAQRNSGQVQRLVVSWLPRSGLRADYLLLFILSDGA